MLEAVPTLTIPAGAPTMLLFTVRVMGLVTAAVDALMTKAVVLPEVL